MKRYRIANKARFTAFAVIMLVLAAFIVTTLLGFNNASGAGVQEYIQVKVQDGDTLWNLAKTYGPSNADIRTVVYEICKINNISAGSIKAGQFITIPASL